MILHAKLMATDLARWRLDSIQGAHRWRYLNQTECEARSQTKAEKRFLGTLQDDTREPDVESFDDAARNGWSFYQSLQLPDGHWACGYGDPSFLLPGLIFAMYITQFPIPREWATEMIRYRQTHVNDDGGWGLHLEGPSTVLAIGLYYVSCKARECLLALGGAVGIPQWGKIWLSCSNLYSWQGIMGGSVFSVKNDEAEGAKRHRRTVYTAFARVVGGSAVVSRAGLSPEHHLCEAVRCYNTKGCWFMEGMECEVVEDLQLQVP